MGGGVRHPDQRLDSFRVMASQYKNRKVFVMHILGAVFEANMGHFAKKAHVHNQC